MSTQPIADPNTRWRLIEELFHRASELPHGDRTAFLEQACAGDPTLLPEVLELLESDSDVAGKVEAQKTPVADITAEAELLPFRTSTDSWLHRRLGHYTVQQELGRGGMGVVYLGRRTTPGPHPQAAIKVVRRNLQDSPALNHFLLERDALARLEHPNIARLLDGGVTGEGIPWLALEYVEGRRLDEFVDQPGMTVQTILGLLIQLCAAVGYVHRNLILHRDLKPGNVMVTPEGVVKLLDFGTLKILENDEASAMTQAGMRPVTLRFASPEHVHGQRVSTASDVYSLGIILYRLLAGRFPEPSTEAADTAGSSKPHKPFQSLMAGFFEDLREDRLEPPSAFTALPMPAELARDLDAITMKCIRYGSAERYQTAEDLAAELTRALENQPVEARGNHRAYLARKFYSRHVVALWTAAAAFLILCAALVVIAHETRIARAQQAQADMGVGQERKLAHLLLFDYFEDLKRIPGSTDAQRMAVSKAISYLDELKSAAPGPAITLESVRASTSFGTLLGSPYYQNLGDIQGAIRVLEDALPAGQQLARDNPGDEPTLLALINLQMTLAEVYLGAGRPKPALVQLEQASKISLGLADNPHASLVAILQADNVCGLIADTYSMRGKDTMRDIPKATAAATQALLLSQRALKMAPNDSRRMRGLAVSLTKLGQLSIDQDVNQAMTFFGQALALLDSQPEADKKRPASLRAYEVLRTETVKVDIESGHPREAEALAHEERSTEMQQIAIDPIDTRARTDLIDFDSALMEAYGEVGDYPKALEADRDYLENLRFLIKLQPGNEAWRHLFNDGLLHEGKDLILAGNQKSGLEECNRAMEQLLPLAGAPDAEPDTLDLASTTLVYLRRNPAADAPLAVAFAKRSIALTGGAPSATQLLNLAQAQRFAGQTAESRDAARAALKSLEQTPNGVGHSAEIAQAKELLARW